MTKLYELKKGSYFTLKEQPQVPPAAPLGDTKKKYKLHNLDGMYSYITDNKDNVHHFAAWTEVEQINE